MLVDVLVRPSVTTPAGFPCRMPHGLRDNSRHKQG